MDPTIPDQFDITTQVPEAPMLPAPPPSGAALVDPMETATAASAFTAEPPPSAPVPDDVLDAVLDAMQNAVPVQGVGSIPAPMAASGQIPNKPTAPVSIAPEKSFIQKGFESVIPQEAQDVYSRVAARPDSPLLATMLDTKSGTTDAAPSPILEPGLAGVMSPETVTARANTGSETTSSLAPSAYSDSAISTLDKMGKTAQARAQQNANVASEIQQIKAEQFAAESQIRGVEAEAVKARNLKAEARYEETRTSIESLKSELANTDWSSYWDSRETGDKILLAISVGLGAFGNTQIGGKNVALDALNNMVKVHSDTRQQKFDSQKARLGIELQDGASILDGAKKLNDMSSAYATADLAQINAQYNAIAEKAKSPELRNKALAAGDEVAAQMISKAEGIDRANRATTSITRDVMGPEVTSEVSPNDPFIRNPQTGKKEIRSDTMIRSRRAFSTSIRAEKNIRPQEDNNVATHPNYAAAYNSVTNGLAGMTGDLASNMGAITRLGDAILKASGKDEGIRLYINGVLAQATAQERLASGASMPISEVHAKMVSYLPPPLDHFGGDNEVSRARQREAILQTRAERESSIVTLQSDAQVSGHPFFSPKYVPTSGLRGLGDDEYAP